MKTKLFIGLSFISTFLSVNAFAQLDACGNAKFPVLGSGLVTVSGWMYKNGNTGTGQVGGIGGVIPSIGNTPAIIYACPLGVNVGIGTATPQTTLDVNGTTQISQQLNVAGSTYLTRGLAIGRSFVQISSANYIDGLIVEGNVGIGTASVGGFKLAVDGKIGAREIRVLAGTGAFPDYVFKKGYKLRTLKDLEDFISENGHLPNIPSAEEVKINNGIDLGDMNVKLLEKVEELTLYLIKQQKEIEELKLKIEKK